MSIGAFSRLNIEFKAQLLPQAEIHKMFIANKGQIPLYLILKVLLPPLWSNVGRKMLREFHFARDNCVLKAPLDPRAGVPFRVDATFVISVNLAGSTCGASARRTPLRVHSTPGCSRTVRSEQIPSRILSEREAALSRGSFPVVVASAVRQGRCRCLSDFASSLPGHVCGHCGPPSH